MNPSIVSAAAPLAHITDLFDEKSAPAPSGTPALYETSDSIIATALVCAGFGSPELRPVGRNSRGEFQAEFVFTLPSGQTPRTVEDADYPNTCKASVQQVIGTLRTLKRRINRLAKEHTD